MSATNIYLRLITAGGPVIGEGLLEGWETSIELKEFGWELEYDTDAESSTSTILSRAARSAVNALGIGEAKVKMGELTFKKRFDLSSYHLHLCIDNKIPVLSATITVLHMRPNVFPPHAPGFVLNAVNGSVESVKLSLSESGKQAELIEDVTMKFASFQMQYLKPVAGQPTPMAPFFHPSPISI